MTQATQIQLDRLVKTYYNYKNAIDRRMAEFEDVKNDIRVLMDAQGAETLLTTDGQKVTYTLRNTTRLDEKAWKQAQPKTYENIFAQFAKTTTSTVLTVR